MSDKNKTRDRFEKNRRRRLVLEKKIEKYKKLLLKEIELEQNLEDLKKRL